MLELNSNQAANVLHEVPGERSFYFYSGLESPLGRSANSLGQLIESIKDLPLQSIEFHMLRADFAKWISMLGDETLSKQIATIAQSGIRGERLRKRLLQTLKLREGWLKRRASAGSA